MDRKTRRLTKLVRRVPTSKEFILEVVRSPYWYGVPYWTKQHYLEFYEATKQGRRYNANILTN